MIPAVMIARMKQALTITMALPVMAVTCGMVLTSGVVNAVLVSRPHSALRAAWIASANQLTAPLSIQPTMSAAQDVLQDSQDDRGQQGQGVANPGALERALGPLDLRGVTAGHQVLSAADGQEQRGDGRDNAGDPGR